MPDSRKDRIRAELIDAQRRLLDTLDRVGTDDWLRTSPTNPGWTVRDLLTHLTSAEIGFVPTLRRMLAGEGGVPIDFDANRWNAGQLRRRGTTSVDQLRPELEAAHAEMLGVLDAASEAALDHRGHMSSGVDGSAADNFQLVADHNRSHTADLQAALAGDRPAADRAPT